eukprot:CAMPEP_0176193814 /NCGR_PEP_ID=MMETSP0121_2-20121125/5680_1 /TAXON_ID=160619 /ORGANISM="Kryptoperidinium foliaceum, Strain CCMP 1326" /LENGTH=72 /DNA_ID=CAMNT_0017532543 /DNA_START=380 /DNA_END=594 /DNA_ORIENTATION=-
MTPAQLPAQACFQSGVSASHSSHFSNLAQRSADVPPPSGAPPVGAGATAGCDRSAAGASAEDGGRNIVRPAS